ncbi:MAG: MarR family transcriptional regulator [Herbinix sp.]|nr:MarR family transcriptional regulator [Herbinix sp.]
MNYEELADQFLLKTHQFQKGNHQKKIDGVMRGETFVIIYIAQHGRSVLPSEISSEMDISSARIAAALNSLEKKGLITRQIDASDRRRILVDLTPAGKEMAESHRQMALKTTARMLELLGEHDAKEFVRIMARLSEIAPKILEHEHE